MKKLFLTSLLLSLFLFSCKEGCDKTIQPQESSNIYASILVLDQNGIEVNNYPVSIDFQKRWCEGDWAIVVANDGTTGSTGEYLAISPTYELNNEDDYILISYTAGTGSDLQEFSERSTYTDFVSNTEDKSHTFEIIR